MESQPGHDMESQPGHDMESQPVFSETIDNNNYNGGWRCE